MDTFLLTSESVTEGHPDKLCDQVSDAILDELMRLDPYARVACETATTTNLVVLLGEITTSAKIDFEKIARETILSIGYDNNDIGLDGKKCKVIINLMKFLQLYERLLRKERVIMNGIGFPMKNILD